MKVTLTHRKILIKIGFEIFSKEQKLNLNEIDFYKNNMYSFLY
jgi:hypothetical protein